MNINRYFLVGTIFCAMLCAGCTTYQWGGYDTKLLAYYKNNDVAKLQKSLESVVKRAEKCDKVPPGLCGEVGYLLYEMGRNDQAIEYFEKEKTLWPESAFIMDKMIRNAQSNTVNQDGSKTAVL